MNWGAGDLAKEWKHFNSIVNLRLTDHYQRKLRNPRLTT